MTYLLVSFQTEEIQKLKRQLADAVREAENCKIERAETINRLTRSLEESQRQCRDLLEGGATKEYGQLKIQVQEAIAGRSISEDMCSALKVGQPYNPLKVGQHCTALKVD